MHITETDSVFIAIYLLEIFQILTLGSDSLYFTSLLNKGLYLAKLDYVKWGNVELSET